MKNRIHLHDCEKRGSKIEAKRGTTAGERETIILKKTPS
jgi:hypothetical protein